MVHPYKVDLNRLHPIICMQRFGFCFIQRRSMETERRASEPGFLVALQIRPSLSDFPVSSPSSCLETAREGPISKHTGPPLKFSTYTFCRGSERACGFSDKKKSFENTGESVYRCLVKGPWILMQARVINLFIYPVRQVDVESGWVFAWLIILSCPS